MDLLKCPQCDKIYELLIPRKQEPVKKPNLWNQSKGFCGMRVCLSNRDKLEDDKYNQCTI